MNSHSFYDIALSMENGLSAFDKYRLYRYFGTAENVYRQASNTIYKILRKKRTLHPSFLEEAKKIEDYLLKSNISTLKIDEPEYPQNLLKIPNKPFLLYLRGNPQILNLKCISLVGTRSPSSLGKKFVHSILSKLKGHLYVIISGLAKGIDSEVHWGALKNKLPTVGILGSGIDSVYPKESKRLAHEILLQGGLLLSEYPPGSKPYRWHFPERNRLIAALSSLTILVEAPRLQSGSIITARSAIEYGKDLAIYLPTLFSENFTGNILLLEETGFPLREQADLEWLLMEQ